MAEHDDKSGVTDIFEQLSNVNRQNLKYLSGALPPFAAALAKWNLEMLRFSAQRAVEYREMSERLAKCRSPVDVWSEQKRFFEDMQSTYSEEMGRLLELMNGISQVPAETEAQSAEPKPPSDPKPSPSEAHPEEFAEQVTERTAETVRQGAEAATEMAGEARDAAQHVTDDARAALQQTDPQAPGVSEAQAAIDVAEVAASTIAQQAEATASLVAGSAAAMSEANRTSDADPHLAQASDLSSEEDSEPDDADSAASMIAEESRSTFSSDDAQEDDPGSDEAEEETGTSEAMISEPAPEDDDELDTDEDTSAEKPEDRS